jgi:hypothetical protein
MTTDRFAPGIQLVALALAVALAGCAEEPQERIYQVRPPQVQVIPLNEQLTGDWTAAYPGGPLHVNIQPDPLLADHNYVARLVDGNYGTIHAGATTFTGTPNTSAPNLVGGIQKCSVPERIGLIRAPMSITMQDANHFTETLARKDACPGFPMSFSRMANLWAPPPSELPPSN